MAREGLAQFRVMDAAGRMALEGQLSANGQLDVRSLAPGNYSLQISMDGLASTLPLVIQR